MAVLAGRRRRVGTIAARHSDRIDVVLAVLVTPKSGFDALVEWYVAQNDQRAAATPSAKTHPPPSASVRRARLILRM